MRHVLGVVAILAVVLGVTLLLVGCPNDQEPAPEAGTVTPTEPDAALAPDTGDEDTGDEAAVTDEGDAGDDEAVEGEDTGAEDEAADEDAEAADEGDAAEETSEDKPAEEPE